MAKLTRLLNSSTAYRDMMAKLLPRGPIWQIDSQPELKAILAGLQIEWKRFHARMLDLLAESDPRTTDELLPEWIAAFGLPAPCGTLPESDDDKRAMLATKVAAQGGQSRDYFLALAHAALAGAFGHEFDGAEWVIIDVRQYGWPFRTWSGHAWEPLIGLGAMFYWRIHLPAGVGGTDTADVIECLLQHYKPAHTVLEFVYDLVAIGP